MEFLRIDLKYGIPAEARLAIARFSRYLIAISDLT